MRVLIAGAAGKLGSRLARHLLERGRHHVRLLVHRTAPPHDLTNHPRAEVVRGDLANTATLPDVCRDVDAIVHLAGILFAPRPERFLPKTNVEYVRNLVGAALGSGVKKFILISFPHVEGETTPDNRATDRLDGTPSSVHARTRLEAERFLVSACAGRGMAPIVIRAGTIYGRGIKMVEAARWLMRRRLLAVWREPKWEHLLALPDFLNAVEVAIEKEHISGIYNVADDEPVTLQQFLDTMADHLGCARPMRLPRWTFHAAATLCEGFALIFGTTAPLTRDFIRIGMVSAVADTSRMKRELLPVLQYPTLKEGIGLL